MRVIPTNLEADLLAFVEDDVDLALGRRNAVRHSIAQDPELARLVAGMREDRAMLGSLLPVRAPASVLAGLESALEQEALAGLERGAMRISGVAACQVVVPRPGVLRTLRETGMVRRMAVAAGLALTVGVAMWGFVRLSSWEVGGNLPGLASNAGRGPASPEFTESASPDLIGGALATDPSGHGEEPGAVVDPGAGQAGGPAMAAATTSEEADSGTATINVERAIELARAGRLAVRIRAGDADSAARETHQVAQQSSKDVRWRPIEAAQVPVILQAMASKPGGRTPAEQDPAIGPYPWAILPDNLNPATSPTRSPAAAEFLRLHPDLRALYTVELPERPQELASLIGALTRRPGQTAEFVELDAAVAPTPSLEPSAILWWGRAPNNWVKRVSVPIVVESLAR